MVLSGETAFGKPTFLPQAKSIEIPSREVGRSIPCRVIYPGSGEAKKVKGVILHIRKFPIIPITTLKVFKL